MVDLRLKLPEGFLEEEDRGGYLVSRKMKELWAIQLDLLVEFDRICRKHRIPYTVSGGTLLGTIRHNGYIPWDDDIDLELLREDYDRFLAVAPAELSAPYFLQTEKSDPGYIGPNAKLRNSATAAILKKEKNRKYGFNQGVFIDLFPLDTVVSDPALREKQAQDIEKYQALYRKGERAYHNYIPAVGGPLIRHTKSAVHKILTDAPVVGGRNVFYPYIQLRDRACRRYNGKKGEPLVGKLLLRARDPKLHLYREDLDEIMMHDFEFLQVPVMKNFDRALTMHFGDYMKPAKDPSYHGGLIFDTDRSYREVLASL